MKRRAVLALSLIPPLVLFTVTFNIPLGFASVKVNKDSNDHAVRPVNRGEDSAFPMNPCEKSWDFNRAGDWRNSAKVSNDSMEITIGINHAKPNTYERLTQLIIENQGELLNTVSMNNKIIAVVVEIPLAAASTFVEKVRTDGLSRYIEPNLTFQAFFVPNDPYWSQQWSPVKIEADYAWNTTMGDSSILVAVIDTGVDWDHPDLAANYVALGYDWVNNDIDPMDDHGHGTHCAGIIAATLNNSIGIAGLARVRIMAEKGLDDWGWGTEDDLANAVIHAVDQGADIISCSWGGYLPSTLIREAIEYAFERGVLVVAAAGNDNMRRRAYPAAYDEVIAVSATDQHDDPADFTNFGDWTELAAPGVNIYSTIWNDSYANKSGTSMAASHVAGVAALVWSWFPNAMRDWVRLWLRYTADDLGDIGFDTHYGYGRINTRRAVEENPPDHDVLISSWEAPPYVETGSCAVVDTTVVNFGAENEADITVQLLVNGSVVNSTTIDSLATRKSVTVNCSWTPSIKGIYNVSSYLVPVHDETVIENNVVSRYVFVGLRTIRVPTSYPTIQEAVDAVGSGFTILVGAGTYYENVVVDKAVSLVGESREITIIDGCGIVDVILIKASEVLIVNFTVRNGGWLWYAGIKLEHVNYCNITNNIITNKDASGVWLKGSSNNSICSNNITANWFGGIGLVEGSSNNSICSNNITANGAYGICLSASSNNSICSNSMVNNVDGIRLEEESSKNSICSNSITANIEQGIYLWESSNNLVCLNNIINNRYGTLLRASSNNRFRDNTIANSTYNFGVLGSELPHFTNNVYTSNTVNGKPIYYFIGRSDLTVPSDAGYVALVNCTNIRVENLNLKNNFEGVLLYCTKNSTVTWNNIANNRDGVVLQASSNNIVRLNNITASEWHGVSLGLASNNTVCSNYITANNWNGVNLFESLNNIVCANNITENNFCGIWLHRSSNNSFYHNNFLDNKYQVRVMSAHTNAWDDGYSSGGNYWSDYADVDLFSGPYQNETGSDGVWDYPYVIDEDNRDSYPFVEPWSPKPPSPVEAIQELNEIIETWNMHKGTENSLMFKLEGALHLLDIGNENGAIHKLMDFINQVEALRDKKLTTEQANQLTSETQRIIYLIKGYAS